MQDPGKYLLPEEPFRILLEKECRRAERYANFFSIMMVKSEWLDPESPLLSTTASLIQGMIRDSDVMGTLQGTHLVAILHHADAQNIDEITVRVRDRIWDQNPGLERNPGSQKIRIGGACFPTHASTPQDLLRAAQERL